MLLNCKLFYSNSILFYRIVRMSKLDTFCVCKAVGAVQIRIMYAYENCCIVVPKCVPCIDNYRKMMKTLHVQLT
jgi:hypothetical protein